MSNVSVIGAGAWGTALALHAARKGHSVTLWAFESEVVNDIQEQRQNRLYLPGVRVPPEITATTDTARAVAQADVVILVPPSKFLRATAAQLARFLPSSALVVVASKGLEETSLKLMSHVLDETLPQVGPEQRVFLSGPSFAKEVAEGLATSVVVASPSEHAAKAVQHQLHAPHFCVYTSCDPVGVQVGGALKNVIAIAAGMYDGLHLGHNARVALITRGLVEIARLGVTLGADPLTFLGLSGMGDLVLTCTSDLSRNRTLGLKVAEGIDPQSFLASRASVTEGFTTSCAAYELACAQGVDMPITSLVYHVLHKGLSLSKAIPTLLDQPCCEELQGLQRIAASAWDTHASLPPVKSKEMRTPSQASEA